MMSFTNEGFTISGCASSGVVPTTLSLNDSNYSIVVESNCYSGTINLSNLSNGTYTLYINSASGKEKALDKLDGLLQIKRARVGNKLVTFDYTNSNVSITVQDFYYEYDVVIDVGHGGWDTGATNIYNQEKNIVITSYSIHYTKLYDQFLSVRLLIPQLRIWLFHIMIQLNSYFSLGYRY